jgi:hypothetical protein
MSKKFYNGLVFLTISISAITLLYYAQLMPLHIDEAGWWFNYTNTSWKNRFNELDPVAQFNGPFHTLSTYLAKLTLPIFGQNGIGWRLPVIIFGLLNCGIIYLFIKNVTGLEKTARLGAVFVMLNPFLNHFSHESRSYVILFFLSTCSYLCLFHLLRSSGEKRGWFLLFFIFLLSYIATLSAVVFLFIFMASLWILKISNYYPPIKKHTEALKNIPIQYLIIFSIATALFFIYIVFYLDYSAYAVGRYYQGEKPPNLITIPDLFSTFLGYKYLDDESSTLYHYPFTIFLVGIFCFVVGIVRSLKAREVHAYFFLVLFITTTSFYIFSGSHIYTRTGVFLAPFLILYQVLGLVFLIETIVGNFQEEESRAANTYWVMGIVVILLATLFIFGKFRNLDAISGNPFEKARNYLKQESGPNDLIISSLYETLGGFYLGDMIREKNYNIYKNGRIDNIYYLAPKANESKIELEMVYPANKKVKFLPLEKFEPVVSFENKGVRSSEVHLYKRNLGAGQLLHVDQSLLAQLEYFGDYNKTCDKKITEQGIRILCTKSPISCAQQRFTFPNTSDSDFQLVLFHHNNDSGTKTSSYAAMKSINQSGIDPVPDIYMLNHLISNIEDTDGFKRNLDLVDITTQKMGDGKNTILCMRGKLFNKNSLIKGIKVFSFGP